MSDPISIIALCLALIVAGILIFLFKKRVIDETAIEGVGQILDGIPAEAGSPFEMIREYSKIAVRTVEQLVKNGIIQKDNTARKEKAMEIVETAAKIDGLEYGAAEKEIADSCVEAEVYNLPRNQKSPDGAEE